MKRGKYYINLYRAIIKQNIKSKITFKVDFFISIISMLLGNLAEFCGIWIVFQNISSIGGWDYDEMLFLYGFTLIASSPNQIFFDNNWNLSTYLYTGDFIKFYFRPVNICFYYMSEIFNLSGVIQFIFGTILLIKAWISMNIAINLLIIIKIVILFFCASLFMIGLMLLAASSCFWTVNCETIITLIYKLKEYAKYPISIFNKTFRILFSFIIPIGFISYYPSISIIRGDKIDLIFLLTFLFGIIFFVFSYKVWMCGVRKYSGTGS